jgi:hypothetical protein
MIQTEEDIKKAKVAHVLCLDDFIFFVRYFFKAQFKRKWAKWSHLYEIGKMLIKVINGEITRLIINIAPRYGKTEMAVKAFIAYGLALNPAAKFIHLSYSDSLALDNSEAVRDLVQSEEYQELFPYVKLKPSSLAKKKWYTADTGGVYATSTGGQITGFGAGLVDPDEEAPEIVIDEEFEESLSELLESTDVSWLGNKSSFGGAIIIDDANKPDDADSETMRNRVNERYDSTISNRTNSRHTPIIIIQQRTHENDLSGYLIRKQGVFGTLNEDGSEGVWHVLSLPSLFVNEAGELTALCPQKHTLEELLALKKHNEIVFERQHMQNPTPTAGLLFAKQDLHFADFDKVPGLKDPDFTYIPCDPANEGGDDFAAAPFKLVGDKIYVTDCIYNTDGTDFNEPALIHMVKDNKANSVGVEAVFGWVETAQRVREELDRINFEGEFRLLRPRTNKHSRILNRSSFIKNHFVFRHDYAERPQYDKFIRNLISYLKIQETGKGNKHDDAPDLCEMAAGYYEKNFAHLFGMTKK